MVILFDAQLHQVYCNSGNSALSMWIGSHSRNAEDPIAKQSSLDSTHSGDCTHTHTLYSVIPHNIEGLAGSSINSLLHCPSFQMSTTIHKTLVCPCMSQSQRLVPRNETPTAMAAGFHLLLSLK